MDAEQVRLGRAVGKDAARGEKHPGERRVFAVLVKVEKLRRANGDVIDDEIGHDLDVAAEGANVVPGTEPCINLRVIDGIEAGIGSVNWAEERQQMNAAKQSGERAIEKLMKFAQTAPGETIYIRSQLDLVPHLPSR
jgi:hypothetical protein